MVDCGGDLVVCWFLYVLPLLFISPAQWRKLEIFHRVVLRVRLGIPKWLSCGGGGLPSLSAVRRKKPWPHQTLSQNTIGDIPVTSFPESSTDTHRAFGFEISSSHRTSLHGKSGPTASSVLLFTESPRRNSRIGKKLAAVRHCSAVACSIMH